MVRDPENTAPFEPEHSRDAGRLRRLLASRSGFELILIEFGQQAYREKILSALAAEGLLPTDPIEIDTHEEALTQAIEFLEANDTKKPAVLIGLNRWLSALDQPEQERRRTIDRRLSRLNYARERLAAAADAPLLIWLDHDNLKRVAREAPDFWSWRAAVLDFTQRPGMHTPAILRDRPKIWEYHDAARLEARLSEIDRYLARNPDDRETGGRETGGKDTTVELDFERGEILASLHRTDDALAAFRAVLAFTEELDRPYDRAVTMGRIADILEARGETDEALRIRNEEELPVFEKLGDIRERAVTMGQIADILQARGETDEALRIRNEEELPVYEKLGDIRERAVTMGKIADILQARGETDEALRIRNEEELPVYEKLGDIRSRAVTMGQIADILQARGETDEALRIRNEEQLPVYEKLGDIRERAVTMGKIALLAAADGEIDDALKTLREECLPVFERIGDKRSLEAVMDIIARLESREQDD